MNQKIYTSDSPPEVILCMAVIAQAFEDAREYDRRMATLIADEELFTEYKKVVSIIEKRNQNTQRPKKKCRIRKKIKQCETCFNKKECKIYADECEARANRKRLAELHGTKVRNLYANIQKIQRDREDALKFLRDERRLDWWCSFARLNTKAVMEQAEKEFGK
jgi:hypothetical protein